MSDLPPDLATDLRAVVAGALGLEAAVASAARLPGGASRETWALDAVAGDGRRHSLILRLDPPGAALDASNGLSREAVLMRAAASAGVPVPAVLADGETAGGLPYILMERVEGETIPRKILRDAAFASARPKLAGRCGEILAAVHRMPPGILADAAPDDPLRVWRDLLDATGQPHPVFELAFRRLAASRPESGRTTVVHGDFRNGNLIVGPEGVRAVLDWELAHLGDPMEDLGWLCVKAWRFGSPLPVGGFGGYDDLATAYEKASGLPVDREALRWWETFGVLRWGILCIIQTLRHLSGGTRSVELAAIGRRVCENEWDLLRMLSGR